MQEQMRDKTKNSEDQGGSGRFNNNNNIYIAFLQAVCPRWEK